MADAPLARVPERVEGLRRGPGALPRRLRGPARRGHGSRRRQRRRQVDAHQGHRRHLSVRRGRGVRRGPANVNIHGPRDAAKLGIEIVYQDLALADNLDVVANMFLGRERIRSGVVLDESSMETSARETLDGLSVTTLRSVRQAVAGLSGGQRQSVAVAKAVMWNSRVVILDEPTAALGVAQTRQVLNLVRRLAEKDLGVAIISHNLHDIFECADRITVLRLGQKVGAVRDGEDDAGGGRPRDHGRQARPRSRDGRAAWRPRHDERRPNRSRRPSIRPRPGRARARRRARRRGGRVRRRSRATCGSGGRASGPASSARCRSSSASSLIFLIFSQLERQLPHAAELHEPDAPDGGRRDDRDRRRLRPPDRRDRPLGRVRERGRRRRHDAASATRRPGLAVVGGDRRSHCWCTTLIGFLQALVITKFGVPSFVVTLAGFLIWSGVVLILTTQYSTAGTIRIQDDTVVGLANNFLSTAGAGSSGSSVVALYAVFQLREGARPSRRAAWPPSRCCSIVLQTVGARGRHLHRDLVLQPGPRRPDGRADPRASSSSFWSFIASRTRFGRHVYAVGGAAEAARRAGINVDRVRIMVFMISEPHGRRRRDHARLAAALGRDEHGRRQPSAARDRGRGHRRYEPLRRDAAG